MPLSGKQHTFIGRKVQGKEIKYNIIGPKTIIPGGTGRELNALAITTTYGSDRQVYYRNIGCGDCTHLYLNLTTNKLVIYDAAPYIYTKDFSNILTLDNWLLNNTTIVSLSSSDNTLVQIKFSLTNSSIIYQ